jgi:hypothetical protein
MVGWLSRKSLDQLPMKLMKEAIGVARKARTSESGDKAQVVPQDRSSRGLVRGSLSRAKSQASGAEEGGHHPRRRPYGGGEPGGKIRGTVSGTFLGIHHIEALRRGGRITRAGRAHIKVDLN